MPNALSRRIALCGLIFSPSIVAADAVTETCMQTYPEDACICASTALREEWGDVDFDAYALISQTAAEQRADGAGLVEAWEEATRAHAAANGLSGSAARDDVNRFGAAHREAIMACTAK